MENKTNVEKTTVVRKRYVITSDGMRMSYEEYIDMINSEKINLHVSKGGVLTRASSFYFYTQYSRSLHFLL